MPEQTDTLQVNGIRCERCVNRLASRCAPRRDSCAAREPHGPGHALVGRRRDRPGDARRRPVARRVSAKTRSSSVLRSPSSAGDSGAGAPAWSFGASRTVARSSAGEGERSKSDSTPAATSFESRVDVALRRVVGKAVVLRHAPVSTPSIRDLRRLVDDVVPRASSRRRPWPRRSPRTRAAVGSSLAQMPVLDDEKVTAAPGDVADALLVLERDDLVPSIPSSSARGLCGLPARADPQKSGIPGVPRPFCRL